MYIDLNSDTEAMCNLSKLISTMKKGEVAVFTISVRAQISLVFLLFFCLVATFSFAQYSSPFPLVLLSWTVFLCASVSVCLCVIVSVCVCVSVCICLYLSVSVYVSGYLCVAASLAASLDVPVSVVACYFSVDQASLVPELFAEDALTSADQPINLKVIQVEWQSISQAGCIGFSIRL